MQEKSGNISIIHLPHRELEPSWKRLDPLCREENWKIFHPSRDHRSWHGKQAKDFSLVPSLKHLPAHTWKLQMSKLRAKGQTALCGHVPKSNHLSAPLSCCCSPGEVTQGSQLTGTSLPFPSCEVTKGYCPLLDIRFTDRRKRWGKKKSAY